MNINFGLEPKMRRVLSAIALVAIGLLFLASAHAQSCVTPPANLISWWRGQSNALDVLGANNGTLVGSPSFAAGEVGAAFNFNGTSQFIRVTDSASLRFSNTLTAEAWINPAQTAGRSSAVFAKYDATFGPNQSAYSLTIGSDSKPYLLISTSGVTGAAQVIASNGVPINTWTHIAATYDGAALKIYLNGVLQGSSAASGNIFGGSNDLGIGASIGGVGNAQAQSLFSGLIDEPSLYNRALSAQEIAAIYNAGVSGKCAPPILITLQPTNQTVAAGGQTTFTVAATGPSVLAYQWYVNGTNLNGATNSSLTLTNLQTNQSGAYNVIVNNGFSTPAVSSNATLTVIGLACDPPPSGIVSWWAGENNALDNVGSNHGIPVNSPTYAPGKVGTAFKFNGNQWIRVPDAPSLRRTNGFTVEAWINPTAYNPSANECIVAKYGGFTAGQSAYSFYLNNAGRGNIQLSTDGSSAAVNLTTTDICPTSTWTHLAATYDGSTVSLYFNGQLEASTPLSGNIFPGTYDLGIGAALGGGGTTQGAAVFNGLIDEPAIYSRALSALEIQAIYNANTSGKCSPPIVITSQPTNQSVPYLGTATLSVGASGGQPITYQWYFNSTNIAGATNSSLVISNALLNQSGAYYVALANSAGPVTSSNATLTVIPPPPCDAAPSNLVSWWSAESNALDNAGGNNGTLVGSPGFVAGKVGLAFSFNGSSQYVRVPDAPNLRFSNAMTAEAWIFPTTYNSQSSSVLVKFDAVVGINQRAWSFGIDGSAHLGFFTLSPDGLNGTSVETASVIPLNTWTHLAATYEGTKLTIYFNGVAQNSTPFTNNIFPGTNALGIGANLGGSTVALFNGLIDEPAVYSRGLSSNEIVAVYNAGISGKCSTNLAPAVSIVPQLIKAAPGGSANFDAFVSGSPTLSYQWKFNGNSISNATNRPLALTNLTTANAGFYALFASNSVSTMLSPSAQLEVVLVSVLGNDILLTNSQYTFTNAVTIKLTNFFASGYIFYTLDGSAPTPESALYTGPFVVTNNVTIRTLGYSPDFQQSAVSDPISINVPLSFSLSVTTPGGGSINRSPNASNYLANTSVILTATPSNGWRFLQWLGDAGGSNPTNTVLMDRNKSLQAIFGTSVSNIAGGNGSITFDPPGGNYPFGTVLQASAIPQTGNFFVIWGDNASGNVNPLAFPVTNANQIISALFYTLDPGEASLAVVPVGHGTVSANPFANLYSTGQSVTLTAMPDANKNFLGWSGDASGTNNPLTVVLNQSKTIYANFSTNNSLIIYPVTPPGLTDGIAVDLLGEPGTHYRLDASTNLINWTSLYDLTNQVGTIHYIDSATNLTRRFYHAVILP